MENVEEGGFFGRVWDFVMMKFHQWFGSSLNLLITGWRETSSRLYTSLIHQQCAASARTSHTHLPGNNRSPTISKRFRSPMRAGRTFCQIYCGRQPACFCAIDSGRMFYLATLQDKTGCAFTDMHARRRIKSDILAKIIQRLLKIDGFQNGVCWRDSPQRTRSNGVSSFQRQKVFSE